jgi:acyl-CoA reductase-like NAD-dependent aldehyde dehydrogenase
MIEHPAVKKVNFTGSTATGAAISSVCGKNLKPCLMELGGKNCSIVLHDADIQSAAHWCVLGSFLHVSFLRFKIPLIV